MRIIGVTGGIGSGKSTVSKILVNFGARIIDADEVAREIVQKGEKALKEITDCFGREVLDDSGELNRKKLGRIVFSDSGKLELLNGITHKHIKQRILQHVDRNKKEGYTGTLVIDAAIPFEHGFIDTADEVWVVTADKEIRIRRVMERNGLTYQEVINRMNSQMSDEEYFKLADKILINNGDFNDLKKEVLNMFESG